MVGRTISHYRILEKLGEGGMGVVYKAEDTSLRRMVALKFLPHFMLGMSHEKARLVREAQAAAALDHPNICTVYEVDEVGGETFIAMALVDGGTLRDKISEGPLTLDEATDFAIQIAQGLAAAHGKGIVHRDMKPGNVMITSDGRAKILDFGLAKSPECTRLTRTGTTVGTIAYMSPEQTRGVDVDHRTDIWSFGVMFFEMLTGRRPFEGGHDQAIIHSILNDELPRVSEFRPDVPEGIDRIAAGALIRSVEERYQSIEDVLADLRSLGTVGATATVSLRAPRPARVRRAAVLLGQWRTQLVAAATIIAVGVAGMAMYETLVRDGPAATGPLQHNRVLVATFENRTGDASLDHIGQTAADRITEGLTKEKLAQVTPTAAASGGAGQDNGATGLLAVAREAGASVLVAGSFRVQSDSLRIEARLLDVSDGTILNVIPEAAPLATPAAAIAKTRSRVMGALAARGDPWIMRDMRSHAPTYEAYQEYRAGEEAVGNKSKLEHYERAIELDPEFTVARISISVHSIEVLMGAGRRAEADSLLMDVLSQPGLLTPHSKLLVESFAATNRGDHSEAVRKLRELAQVEPDYEYARYACAMSAMRVNRPHEVVEICRPLLEQDPVPQPWVYGRLVNGYHRLGEFEHELETARQAIELFPDEIGYRQHEICALAALGRVEELDRIIEESASTPVGSESKKWGFYKSFDFQMRVRAIEELRAHGHMEGTAARADDLVAWQRSRMAVEGDGFWPRFRLACALYRAERWEEAREIFETLEPEDDYGPALQCYLAGIAARTGDRERALEIKEAFLADDLSWEPGLNNYFAASIPALLGDHEEAIDLLHLAIAEGNDIWGYLHLDQDFEVLWDYPPFRRLLEPRG